MRNRLLFNMVIFAIFVLYTISSNAQVSISFFDNNDAFKAYPEFAATKAKKETIPLKTLSGVDVEKLIAADKKE